MLKQDDFIKAKLVEIGWQFASSYQGGHLAGQMIMSTIANRVRCGWGSWLEVLSRVPNFMAENELPPLVYPSVWEGHFVKMLHAVDAVFDGSVLDLSKGALYWGSLNKIERPWFIEKVLENKAQHPRVADLNALSFWK